METRNDNVRYFLRIYHISACGALMVHFTLRSGDKNLEQVLGI